MSLMERQFQMKRNNGHSRALEIKTYPEDLPTVSVKLLGGTETYSCIAGAICICIFTPKFVSTWRYEEDALKTYTSPIKIIIYINRNNWNIK